MNQQNPYAAPETITEDEVQETYQPKAMALSGRIGRVRYLGYTMGVWLIFTAILLFLMFVFQFDFETSPSFGAGMSGIIMIVLYIALIIYSFGLARRRLNDMNYTGWLCILLFIPIIGFLMTLWLLFGRGTDGANDYGPQPCPNSAGVVAMAWSAILIPVIGILAAIAIPAYHEYVEKTRQVEQSYR